MTIPFAIFASISVFVIAVFAFLTIVYLKEFSREEASIKEYMKARNEQIKAEKDIPIVYLVAEPAPKPKKKTETTDVKKPEKKDMN